VAGLSAAERRAVFVGTATRTYRLPDLPDKEKKNSKRVKKNEDRELYG
jgi:hypothetical protein